MDQQYDNNNKGVLYMQTKTNLSLIGTGTLNDDGEEKRIAITRDTMPDGQVVRDVYVKVGRMWDNSSDNPSAPQISGVIGVNSGEKRIAAWLKDSKAGQILSLEVTEKRASAEQIILTKNFKMMKYRFRNIVFSK